MISVYEKYLPEEFKSGNNIPVERATIKRERMVEILSDLYDKAYEDGWKDGVNYLD